MKVVVAGGSGFIGRALVDALDDARHDVVVLTRGGAQRVGPARAVWWDGRTLDSWQRELEDAAAVVNLAGTRIAGRRWTRRRREHIRASRIASTAVLVDAIERLPENRRPRVLVNASGIGFAEHGEAWVDERSAYGSTFLASVCRAWETTALRAEELGVRVVLMRTPVVIARDALALKMLSLPFRFFLGGRLGSGRQWFPWIHLDDLVALYQRAIKDETLRGPINATAPDLRREADVANEIARVLGRPARVPAPALLLRLVLGRQADLLLHGQRARSRKLDGFRFRFGDLRRSLTDALR